MRRSPGLPRVHRQPEGADVIPTRNVTVTLYNLSGQVIWKKAAPEDGRITVPPDTHSIVVYIPKDGSQKDAPT